MRRRRGLRSVFIEATFWPLIAALLLAGAGPTDAADRAADPPDDRPEDRPEDREEPPDDPEVAAETVADPDESEPVTPEG